MTRHVAQKVRCLTIAALVLFFAIATVLASVAALAQVRSTGSASANASADSAPESGVVPAQTGRPLFRMPIYYPAGKVGFTEFVAVADLNGDGNLDLVVADQNCGDCTANGKVSVLLANRSGTGFRPPVVYDSGGQWCSSVAVADVNGDGKPDLVVTNFQGENGGPVGVLLGNGDGTFQPVVTYGSGGQADSIVVADMNGDGKPDLIVGLDSTHGEVFLGNGDGTFQTGVPYSASGGRSVAVADLNHDGKLDLVVAGGNGGNPSIGIVSVLLGKGDGTFQPTVTYDTGVSVGGWANSVAIADFDGDGKLDLVVANYPDRTVGVLLGKGDGTFQPVTLYDSGASLAESVAAADLNGDGRPDIVVGDSNNGAGVLLGNGDGSFQPAIMLNVGTTSVAIADINRDGWPDVVVSNGAAVSVILNNGPGLLATATAVTSNLNPSLFGQSVTFTATVSSTSGTPSGTVVFKQGTTSIGSATLANGAATLSVSTLGVGTQSIKAAYQGGSGFASSKSAVLMQVVNTATTTTALASSAVPGHINQTIIYTATVTTQYGGAATGTVAFEDGGATIATVALTGDTAAYTTSYTAVGTHSITATYSGDGNNSGSESSVLTEKIFKEPNEPLPSTTTVATSGTPSFVAQPVTFTATVTSSYGAIPDGELVTFFDDPDHTVKTEIGTGITTGGVATFTTSSLAPKGHVITATYAGDTKFKTSSGTLVQTVDKYTTTASLVPSQNPTNLNEPVTFTVTVTSEGGPTPTGEVDFPGLGTATLNGNGMASITWDAHATCGARGVQAIYEGDVFSNPVKSNAVREIVICTGD
jgi:hypothetical protein